MVNEKISLKARKGNLAKSSVQLQTLEQPNIPSFGSKLKEQGMLPLKPSGIDILQVNVGKMCNQVCKHCHVDAGPDRKEIMTIETMQQCIDVVRKHKISTVDLTGGAPEMNPDFRFFVQELRKAGAKVMVRCNLTIILANKKYNELPEFFANNQVEVVSSLPHFSARRTDAQRGDGVFEKSIKAIEMLNAVGYGIENSGLQLNLVYNPSGAFLPGDQASLEQEFKDKLLRKYNLRFNHLYAITNMPVSRFLDYLKVSGNYETYMNELVGAFNPMAVSGLMCRNTISVGWDGFLYDCDFNQMLDLKVQGGSKHISDFQDEVLSSRNIIINQHCYGCTAGAGSSCGGETT